MLHDKYLYDSDLFPVDLCQKEGSFEPSLVPVFLTVCLNQINKTSECHSQWRQTIVLQKAQALLAFHPHIKVVAVFKASDG